jgi:hypothetical protein
MKRRIFLVSGLQISATLALSAACPTWLRVVNKVAGEPDGDTTRSLERLFLHPPASAQPYTIWHWMNGVVNREGITADLASFKQAGLGGVQLFLVGGSEPK